MNIYGKRVILKKTAKDDLGILLKLWNDGRVMKWVGFPNGLGYKKNDMLKWFQQISKNQNKKHFMVMLNSEICGEVFYNVDGKHQRAGLDIKIFPEFQGRGIGYDALTTLINHCFKVEKNINELWVEPSSKNISAKKLYQKCGLVPKKKPSDMREPGSYWAITRMFFSAHKAERQGFGKTN